MSARTVHLFAAAVAFAVAGTSAAGAGVIDGSLFGPVRWSCGSNCGPMPTVVYGPPLAPVYYPERLYPVDQGPTYQPPLLPYGVPSVVPGPDPRPYPYVSSYGYPGYTFSGGGGYRYGYGGGYRYGAYRYGGYRQGGYGYGGYRVAGHRPLMRAPLVRRGPVGGRRWHN